MSQLDDALAGLFGGQTSSTSTAPSKVATPAPTQPASSQAPADQVVDPFTIGKTVAGEYKTSVDRQNVADQMLGNVLDMTQQNTVLKESAAAKLVQAKTALTQQTATDTTDYAAATRPLFQKKIALADREAQIQAMNPLQRLFVTTFSQSHNPDWIKAQADAVDGQLNAQADNFNNLMGLRKQTLATVQAAYEDATQLGDLHQADAVTNAQLAASFAGSARETLNTALQGVQAQTEITKAKEQSRIDMLGGMSHDQVNQALGAAQKNGGQVTINGVTLRQGELKQTQNDWVEKELALKGRQLAIQSQQMELANQFDAKWASHASESELKAAAVNGGKLPNGHQIGSDVLVHALAARQALNGSIIDSIQQAGNTPVYASVLSSLGQTVSQTASRSKDLFGQVPDQLSRQNQTLAMQIGAINQGQKDADAKGLGEQYRAQVTPQLMKLQDTYHQGIVTMAKQYVHGDEDLGAFYYSYLSGTPLNPTTSTKAIIKLVRGTGVPGLNLTPQAKAALATAKQVVAAYDAGSAGDNVMTMGQKKSDREKGIVPSELIDLVNQKIKSTYAKGTLDQIITAAPMIAKTLPGDHPASQIDPRDISAAFADGDERAYGALGKYGLNAATAKAVLAGGPTGAAWAQAQKANGNTAKVSFSQIANEYQAAASRLAMQNLDASHSAKPGFKPSLAYADLVRDPQFQAVAVNRTQAQSQTSAADFAFNATAGSGTQSDLYNFADLTHQTANALVVQDMRQKQSNANKLRDLTPLDSFRLTLHTLPTLNASEADILAKAVVPRADDLFRKGGIAPGDALDTVLLRSKFDDPTVEKIRQAAVREYERARPSIYKGLNGFFGNLYDHGGTSIPLTDQSGTPYSFQNLDRGPGS